MATPSEKLYQSSISIDKNLTFFDTGGHAASFQRENWDKIVELIFSKTGN
ncbi:MAG: hypothetical protein LBL13_09270 [Bacteroidales bacterium]|nr:hypothetical protein [Bacteroidales bacterium]